MFSLVYISVPPIPITHFSITTYTVPTYEQSPQFLQLTSASPHIYTYMLKLYIDRSPHDVKLTSAYAHIQYGRAIPHYLVIFHTKSKKHPSKTYARITYTQTGGINCRHRVWGPKTRIVVTSTTGPPGPHWPKKVLYICYI